MQGRAQAQARVSRLQVAVDLLGVDFRRRIPHSISEAAKRQCRVQPVGERLDSCLKFVERAPRTRGTTEKNRRGSTAGLGQLRVTVGRRVARSGTIACRSTRMSHSATDTQRAGERNHRIAGVGLGSGTIEERTEPMDGETHNSQAVRYGFIKIRMKVVNFIRKIFIKNHFHQKPLSSKTTFIKNHFHQKTPNPKDLNPKDLKT